MYWYGGRCSGREADILGRRHVYWEGEREADVLGGRQM